MSPAPPGYNIEFMAYVLPDHSSSQPTSIYIASLQSTALAETTSPDFHPKVTECQK